jgi:hypothetical protein
MTRITHQMSYAQTMRTTLDISDELLLMVKEMAQQQNKTAGSVVSSLLRKSLQPRSFKPENRNGIPCCLGDPVVLSLPQNW